MRIAIVRHHVEHAGGAETYADAIASALTLRGHDVGVWYETGAPPGASSRMGRWYGALGVEAAVADLAAWQPDVLFVQGVRSISLEATLLSLAPAVLFAHGYAGLCVSGTRLHSRPGMTPCTRTFGLACLALYYPRGCGGWDPRTAVADYRLQSERRRLIGRYGHVVVASQHMAAEFARQGLDRRVSVVGLPIDAAPMTPRVSSDRAELLFCGRLERTKGPDVALRAAARAAEAMRGPVRLTFAGAGSLELRLRRDGAALAGRIAGFEVQFAGWVGDTLRDDLLRRTDFLLVTSRWPEPFGLVGPEAGARGVPAIAFDVGGIAEWLRDRVSGRLVPLTSSPEIAFADAIRECLALDSPARERMRDGARLCAARFSMDAHLAALEAVFRSAQQERP